MESKKYDCPNIEVREISIDCDEKSITNGELYSIYYGVHIPSDTPMYDNVENNVFTDKAEALKLVKKYKKARFKAFSYYHEAAEFAMQGAEFPNNNVSLLKNNSKKDTEQSSPVIGEKYQFRGPKSQDLVKLRKAIECGDMKAVETTVWENPRYLISSGDTPSILQEGFRYNALHVAAKAKNAAMAEFILNTISNVNFIELLYGEDDHQDGEERAKILLDLYLNTPDKGLNETPLHFAVKFGALQVVEVLVSFPQCDRNVKNKYGKLPNQIICDRCEGYGADKLKERMSSVLGENYYVPVLRSEDNCIPPVIGEPFSPSSPPNYKNDPLQSRLEIHAYAGPMEKKEADKFRKIWKTPPRSTEKSVFKKLNIINNFENVAIQKVRDHEKGLESAGRELASRCNIGWKEYWPFLGNFIDLSSQEGLDQLENYLKEKNDWNVDKDWSMNSTKSLTCSISPKEKEEIAIDSPITDLCKAFESCTLSDNGKKSLPKNNKIPDEYEIQETDLNTYICLERSCQVFAHRVAIDIAHLIKTEDHTSDILEAQIKILEQLILSYVEDGRFTNVNFHSVHARLAALVSVQLRDLECDENDVRKYTEKLQEICTKNFDCFSSDDESFSQITINKKSTSSNKQLVCVLGHILNILNNSENTYKNCSTEEECRATWDAADKCTCVWQAKNSRKSNSGKRISQKLKMSLRNCYDAFSRKLTFGRDEIDGCEILKEDDENISNQVDDSSSDDEFFTPPTSPTPDSNSSDEEDFNESRLPESDVFIEGSEPTKVDRDVFNALKYSTDRLNSDDYPNIYKWYHAMTLFTEDEKKSWCSPRIEKNFISSTKLTSTPCRGNVPKDDLSRSPTSPAHASPKSWFRVTGANSPRASLHTYRNNVSFNL